MFIEGKLQKEQARKMFENSQKLSHLNFHAQKMYSFSWPKLQLHIMILIFGAKFKISLIWLVNETFWVFLNVVNA